MGRTVEARKRENEKDAEEEGYHKKEKSEVTEEKNSEEDSSSERCAPVCYGICPLGESSGEFKIAKR